MEVGEQIEVSIPWYSDTVSGKVLETEEEYSVVSVREESTTSCYLYLPL